MRLEEAIRHSKQKAIQLASGIGTCACAREHLQLVKWLEELQLLRKTVRAEQKKSNTSQGIVEMCTCNLCQKRVERRHTYPYIQAVPGPGDDCASIARCCKKCGDMFRIREYKGKLA